MQLVFVVELATKVVVVAAVAVFQCCMPYLAVVAVVVVVADLEPSFAGHVAAAGLVYCQLVNPHCCCHPISICCHFACLYWSAMKQCVVGAAAAVAAVVVADFAAVEPVVAAAAAWAVEPVVW